MTVQKLIDMLNMIPDKNLLVEVCSWDESVPATDIYITTHDEPQHHVDDNGNPIEFTDYVLIDSQWGTKGGGLHILTDYAEKYPNTCEYESTTKNDLGVDCISRKAILDELEKWDWQELYLPIHFKQMLDELPSVTPQEPRKGHWIEVTNGRGGHECDVCHDYAPSFQSGNEYLSAFCPNCGADMRTSED